jgi:hypothetical protein
MANTSNLYRKARALVAKTVTAGCTPHEHVAATNLAVGITAKHGLDASRIDWPAPPAGFAWSGETGRSEVAEKPVEPKAKPARKGKASTANAKSARRSHKATDNDAPKLKRRTGGERLVDMLQRPDGATLEEIMAAFGVLAHSARAIISIEARKKRGLDVKLDRATGRYSVAG